VLILLSLSLTTRILFISTDTGNDCKHPGYDDFNPSWPSTCAPNKDQWIATNRRVCGEVSRIVSREEDPKRWFVR